MALTILLTGATRGLGRALLDRFDDGGHAVLGCGRDPEAIAALAASFAPPHDFAAVDVADESAVSAWAGRLLAAGRIPDLIVNNAALMNRPAPLWEQGSDEFGRLVDVNVKGVFHLIRAFLPAMIERGEGVVANISSGWGRSVAPEVAPYCASKFAVEGLSRALAAELPPGLASVAVNPGVIDTEMLRECWGEAAAAFPGPEAWSRSAASRLLSLGPGDNGRSIDLA